VVQKARVADRPIRPPGITENPGPIFHFILLGKRIPGLAGPTRRFTFRDMSTTEILAQLSRLSAADRDAIRSQLDAIDSAAPPSPEEKRLIEARMTAYRAAPERSVPWAVAETEVRKELGL
jgi:hypothetical protein